MEANLCEDCCFWRPFADHMGECHCKAPLPYIYDPKDETLHKGTRWPLTKGEQRCGEFQPRHEAQNKGLLGDPHRVRPVSETQPASET